MVASSVGLTYSDFMSMTPAEVQAYSDGYQRRTNREAWLNGLYTLDAVTAVASAILSGKNKRNVYQYPKQPRRELQPMTEAEKQAEIEAERLRAYAYFDSIVQACKEGRVEKVEAPKDPEALRAELYMRQMVRAGKNWGGFTQEQVQREQELQKKRAQVRGLQAMLYSSP